MEFFNIDLFNLSLSLFSSDFSKINDFTLAYFKILNIKYFNSTHCYSSQILNRYPYMEFRVYDSFGKLDRTQVVIEFINGSFKARLENF